jgi:hypothetical protein
MLILYITKYQIYLRNTVCKILLSKIFCDRINKYDETVCFEYIMIK